MTITLEALDKMHADLMAAMPDPQQLWIHPLMWFGTYSKQWRAIDEANCRNPFGGRLFPVREDRDIPEGVVVLWSPKNLRVDAITDLRSVQEPCDLVVTQFAARRLASQPSTA